MWKQLYTRVNWSINEDRDLIPPRLNLLRKMRDRDSM